MSCFENAKTQPGSEDRRAEAGGSPARRQRGAAEQGPRVTSDEGTRPAQGSCLLPGGQKLRWGPHPGLDVLGPAGVGQGVPGLLKGAAGWTDVGNHYCAAVSTQGVLDAVGCGQLETASPAMLLRGCVCVPSLPALGLPSLLHTHTLMHTHVTQVWLHSIPWCKKQGRQRGRSPSYSQSQPWVLL